MGANSYKHEIKTSFLIINSCIALTLGLFPLSLGLGILFSGAPEPQVITSGSLVVGTLILGLASLGHYGAFLEKRAALRVYAAVTGLVTFVQVMAVCKFPDLNPAVLVYEVFHIALMVSATTSAMALAKLVRRIYPVLPAAPAPAATAPAPTAPTAL